MVVEGLCFTPQQSTIPDTAARAPSVLITAASGGTGVPAVKNVAVPAQQDAANPKWGWESPSKMGSRWCHPLERHGAAPTVLEKDLHTKEPPAV